MEAPNELCRAASILRIKFLGTYTIVTIRNTNNFLVIIQAPIVLALPCIGKRRHVCVCVRVCPSVRRSVGRSVCLSVGLSVCLSVWARVGVCVLTGTGGGAGGGAGAAWPLRKQKPTMMR